MATPRVTGTAEASDSAGCREAVALALEVRSRGGFNALPPNDPLRRRLLLAVARAAGLDRLPSSRERPRPHELYAYARAVHGVLDELDALARRAQRHGRRSVLDHHRPAARP